MPLPEGLRLELIAAEPLIRQPSGMCWDEKGRLFVSELHGYNLEGQYERWRNLLKQLYRLEHN
mgnify:CR=1 FL=1